MITYSNENADALLDSLNDNIGIPEFKNRLNEVYLSSDFHILKEFRLSNNASAFSFEYVIIKILRTYLCFLNP